MQYASKAYCSCQLSLEAVQMQSKFNERNWYAKWSKAIFIPLDVVLKYLYAVYHSSDSLKLESHFDSKNFTYWFALTLAVKFK